MKSKMIFVAAALLVMLLAGAVHAKPDGSFGTNCAGCHTNGIPGSKPNTPPADPPAAPPTDPPPTDPPSAPPTDPPAAPPTDTPGTPPADGGTEQPGEPVVDPPSYVASDHILSLELGTVWHYGSLDTADDVKYVFYAAVETDTSVNLVDVITPKGNRLQITSEPGTEVDNVKTWFREADDVRVWEYEATFDDAGELKDYGKGDYTVEVHYDGGSAEARVKYGGIRPKWGMGASGGADDDEDQPSEGADRDSRGQKPDKNVTLDDDDDDDDEDEEGDDDDDEEEE